MLTFLLPGVAALAQVQDKNVPGAPVGLKSPPSSPPSEPRLDELSFDDTPLDQVIDVLRKRFPDMNFVASGDLSGRRLSLKLRNVTLMEVIQAIQWTCEGDVHIQRDGRMVAVQTRPSSRVVSRACSLAAYLGEAPRTDAEARERDFKLRQLEDAITEYQEMRVAARGAQERPAAQLTFRVHQGTRLLLVTGSSEEVESIEHFVRELESGIRAAQMGPARLPGPGITSPPAGGPSPKSQPDP